MKLRQLGKTDLQVSALCLGTMQFGWTADEDASFATMDAFVAAGGTFLDTADIYSNWMPDHNGGEAEAIIGRWMKARGNRDGLVIATKVRGRMWDGPDGEGLSRAHIERAVEDSLRRLQIETIDLYQCHWPDDDGAIEETLTVFQELIDAGKVRYVGASNYTEAQELSDALRIADERKTARFVSLQPHHNLVHRTEFEDELEAFCLREDLGVIPYSPLAGGFLTGKYRAGSPLPKTMRSFSAKKYMTDEGFAVIDALASIAGERGVSIPAVALAWQLARPAITAPIIGANSPAQLADLLPAVDIDLSDSEVAALDAASA
ncbi:MAG: aldo/keto reductase [Dehalococcoidia bacterium]